MRPNPILAKKGETPARMVCAVTGKPIQSGATAVSLSDEYWCYVNPRRVLTDERKAELLASVPVAPKATIRKTDGDK